LKRLEARYDELLERHEKLLSRCNDLERQLHSLLNPALTDLPTGTRIVP
jgi:hypothetical protein